jgi:hypothetical protein
MSELAKLITRLQRGIAKNASYVKTIRHPHLLLLSLQELNELIGNDKVKVSVANQVSHLIMMKRRAFENTGIKEDNVMLNTVLYGPPGVGKTLVGAKLAKIWYSLGYLDGSRNSKDRQAGIADLVKDLMKDTSNSTGTDDNITLLYVMFILTMVIITVLSLAWSFYSRFGGFWTIIVVSLFVLFILIIAYYISVLLNSNNDTTNNSNKSNQDNKNTKGSKIGPKNSTNSANKQNNDVNNGLHGDTEEKEGFEMPVIPFNIPSDDDVIKIVTRADFVDRYVGWSDKKTIKLLQENLGKVLFVDEAYSLVTDMHDSFGIEVLTTINLFLSQHPKEIIVVFAGYKDLMETTIFSVQPGLKRRFMWQFDCSGYTPEQMFEIFKMQLNKKGWGLTDNEASKQLFLDNPESFPAFGGDTERLGFYAELEHSRDFISNEEGMSINLLTPEHIRRGLAILNENNIQSDPNSESTNPLANMMKLLSGKKKEEPKRPVHNVNTKKPEPARAVYSDTESSQLPESRSTVDDSDLIEAVREAAASRVYH